MDRAWRDKLRLGILAVLIITMLLTNVGAVYGASSVSANSSSSYIYRQSGNINFNLSSSVEGKTTPIEFHRIIAVLNPAPITPPPTGYSKYVLIRADDIWWVSPGSRWLYNLANTKGIKVTYGVVPFSAKGNEDTLAYLAGLNAKSIELATHGYKHEDLLGLNYTTQFKVIQKATKLMKKNFYQPYTWICPYGDADQNTLKALIAQSYHSISADQYITGVNSQIDQFFADFQWEVNWNDKNGVDYENEGIEVPHHTYSDFVTQFNKFLNDPTKKYFTVVVHPDTYFNNKKQKYSDARYFEQSIDYMNGKVGFLTMEQAHQLNLLNRIPIMN